MVRHPVNDLLEQLGRRWTLRVLWELRDGPVAFRELRRRCDGVSSSVLTTRLRELGEAGLVEAADDGYALTADGRRLGALLLELSAFARDRAT